IDSLADHFCEYQSSSEASHAASVEALPNPNDAEVGTSLRHSKCHQLTKHPNEVRKKLREQKNASSQPNHALDSKKPLEKDLPALPIISEIYFSIIAVGYRSSNKIWEILEYLGDIVLTSCLLKFSGPRYLQKYEAKDASKGMMNIVTNKILAAYSLTLAYFGAYYLASGELATCKYLESLITPLLDIFLEGIKAGQNNLEDSYQFASRTITRKSKAQQLHHFLSEFVEYINFNQKFPFSNTSVIDLSAWNPLNTAIDQLLSNPEIETILKAINIF
ncbi:31402_t:CDS:2, partial [Gigaspora margarita]